MKVKPEQLNELGYEVLAVLKHSELVPFLRTYIRKKTFYSIIYTVSNLIILLFTIFQFFYKIKSGQVNFDTAITNFSFGIALAFVLIPIHEYIHVVAYKSQGATNTSYDANFKKFYFMALADKFVADKKEFKVVALAPVFTISLILIALLPFVNLNWYFTLLATLLTHTAFSSGDFALLSYFNSHHAKEIVTYDDTENKTTYFYQRNKKML